jgi:EAL domain-containing protein (putative c-di-GMP-specific phosphodiesterase class I)
LRDLDVTRSVFTELDGIGVVVSLDDFSGGRSALAGLKHLPLRLLKVGRAFVGGMIADERHAAVVRSSIELGHDLGLGVVAVGVESQAIRQALVDLGCDHLQGFSICPPLSAGELLAWLDEHQTIALDPAAEAESPAGPVIDVSGDAVETGRPDAPAV